MRPKIILGCLIALLCIVLPEAWLRIAHPEFTRSALISNIERNDNNWARPDAEFHHMGEGLYGLRFPENCGRPRIAIIGDSFAMGFGVDVSERFGAVLHASMPAYEVDVLAVSSYSPVIYRNIVRRLLGLCRYRVIALFVDQTDPADELIYQGDVAGPRGFDAVNMRRRNEAVRQAYLAQLAQFSGRWNPRRLALINLFVKPTPLPAFFPAGSPHASYARLSYRRMGLILEFNLQPDSGESREMEKLLNEHLDESVDLCGSHGVPLFLAANPWEFQVSAHPKPAIRIGAQSPATNRLEDLLHRRYGRRLGVSVLPLTDAFRSAPDPNTLFLPDTNEVHWNRNGHALVAKVLKEAIARLAP